MKKTNKHITTINKSVAGGRPIVSSIFDAVPSWNGSQGWKTGSSRTLRINRGSTVQVAGILNFRDFFGRTRQMQFARWVKVPTNSYALTVY